MNLRVNAASRSNRTGPLLWLTNVPTPYRLALWRKMAEQTAFQPICLNATEANRQWDLQGESIAVGVMFVRARAWQVNSELVLHMPSRRLLRALHPDASGLIIDGWASPAFLFALLIGRMRGIPVWISYRATSDSHRFDRGPVAWLRVRGLCAATGILAGGPATVDALRQLGIPGSKIQEIDNVVDVHMFAQASHLAREAVSSSPGHRFLYVGQLVRRKNIASAIEAFSQVRDADDSFTIVGSGEEEFALKEVVSQLGLASSVHFVGAKEGQALVRTYAEAHTLILPSLRDVWGLVAAEALAAGLHCVVSNKTGASTALAGMRGVFVAGPEPQSLAEAMTISRREWTGPIDEPEILRMSPETTARKVVGIVTGPT